MTPELARGQRERLPNRRRTVTQKAVVGGAAKIYVSIGRFADGRLAEVFVRCRLFVAS